MGAQYDNNTNTNSNSNTNNIYQHTNHSMNGGYAYIMICIEEEEVTGSYSTATRNRRNSRSDSMSDHGNYEEPDKNPDGSAGASNSPSPSPWIPKYLASPGCTCDIIVTGNILTSLREIQSIASLGVTTGQSHIHVHTGTHTQPSISGSGSGSTSQYQQHIKYPHNYFSPQNGVKLTQLQRLLTTPNQFLQQLSGSPVITPYVDHSKYTTKSTTNTSNTTNTPTSTASKPKVVSDRPRNIPILLWNRLSRSYNASQLHAICTICGDRIGGSGSGGGGGIGASNNKDGSSSSNSSSSHVLESLVEHKLNGVRLTLLQGPPGTGKVGHMLQVWCIM